MRTYSTAQAAQLIGVHKTTLKRWLISGKVSEPRRIGNGGISARVWTGRDIERVRKFKTAHYCKGRGRKKGR
jgi:excisionase family DNA binding protein